MVLLGIKKRNLFIKRILQNFLDLTKKEKNMSVSFLLPSGAIPVPSGPGGG